MSERVLGGRIGTGLVSVTFRKLSPSEIIELVGQAGLEGIEWGGDVHVPAGDLDTARLVGEETRAAGLEVLSYGSYYRLSEDPDSLDAVLETAVALGTGHVRVWAGAEGSHEADEGYFEAVAADFARAAGKAEALGLRISTEFHEGTLTDTPESALRVLRLAGRSDIGTYWQPGPHAAPETADATLQPVIDWVTNVHVFTRAGYTWYPLRDGYAMWQRVFAKLAATGRRHAAMIEFVASASPEQFLEDAETLRELLAGNL